MSGGWERCPGAGSDVRGSAATAAPGAAPSGSCVRISLPRTACCTRTRHLPHSREHRVLGSRRVPPQLRARCHRVRSASSSHGVRAPQIPGQLLRASPRPCPAGPVRSPGAVTAGGCLSPVKNLPRCPLLWALGRSSGGARAGGAGRIGQGREQQERVCTGTWGCLSRDLAPPGPCPIGARDHRAALARLRGAGPRVPECWWRGAVGSGLNGSSGRWELLGTCLNKVPPGRANVRAGAGPKNRRRALAAPAELTHRPGSLPGASGSAAPPHGGSLSFSGEQRGRGIGPGELFFGRHCVGLGPEVW